MFAYNNSRQESTGKTPFFILIAMNTQIMPHKNLIHIK